jgi:hypothetical protein
MFIYDVKDEGTMDKGLRWFDAPSIIVNNILGLSKDKRTGKILDVSDPIDGRDVEFVRKGTGLNSKYEAFNLVKTEAIPKEWHTDVPTFDDVLLVPTYEQMKIETSGEISQSNPEKEISTPRPTRTRRDPTEEVEEVKVEETPQNVAPPQQKISQGGLDNDDTVRSRIARIRQRRMEGTANGN